MEQIECFTAAIALQGYRTITQAIKQLPVKQTNAVDDSTSRYVTTVGSNGHITWHQAAMYYTGCTCECVCVCVCVCG